MIILIDSNWVRVISIQFRLGLLLQCSPRNCLESLFDIDRFLCTSLKIGNVAFALTPSHSSLLGNHPLALLHVDLVAQNYEGEVFRIVGCSLYQEFISPRIERFEGLGVVYVVTETTAVCSTVEGDTEGLETFLTGCVPELHGYETVVYHDFAREEIGTDRGFVG